MVIMSRYIDERVKAQIQPVLASLVNPVKIVFFTQKNACSPCLEQEELLRELSAMSTKLTLEVYDFVLNGDEVMNYKVDKIPATAVVGKRDFSILFYGLTVGYEFKSFYKTLLWFQPSGQV
jgi:alkyl hydroperoxide reductase subunit AhpF